MDAGQVAGLLVLLGVVGVLTAIVGSGIEAGPVKFPSIPGSRQKPLALASILVVAGGIAWWVVQRQSTGNEQAVTTTSSPPPTGKLRVSLIPEHNPVPVGGTIRISAEVYDSNQNQLGDGQCQLDWKDTSTSWTRTTDCVASPTESPATGSGVHLFVVRAQGRGGLNGQGIGKARVTVEG